MKGFEVGNRVRSKVDLPSVGLKKGDIRRIACVDTCCCGTVVISWGDIGEGSYCKKCWWSNRNEIFKSIKYFDPIEDDEIEIKSDTFIQVTFTKIIENVPAGVN